MFLSNAPFEQEFYGRTGRGLGFITFASGLICMMLISLYADRASVKIIIKFLALSGLISSIYALMQRFDWDIFSWVSRTNGVIGTIGNPNFQSSFTAMSLIPMIVYLMKFKFRTFIIFCTTCIFVATVFFAQSTQGYVAIAAAFLVVVLTFTWYRNKLLFIFFAVVSFALSVSAIFGMVNKGPFSYYLYKVSVQSRGDFWRSAFRTANEHPLFGVGLDSFGDYFLIYRDKLQIEMTDNAHNYFLEFAATGGYILTLLYICLILFTLYNYFSVQRKIGKFNFELTALFCAWIVFQLQSVISPGSLTLIFWNFVISGFFIGYNSRFESDFSNSKTISNRAKSYSISRLVSNFLVMFACLVMFPLMKTDYDLKQGLQNRNANQIMRAMTAYPESSVRYNIFTQELFKSNLLPQALEMGRAAINFNPDSVSAWALVFVNPQAPAEERKKAMAEILRLDPLNTEVFKVKID
jgi:O-antigen ligase